MARTEEEVAVGIIPCRFGDTTRYLPTLKRKAAREWKATAIDVLKATASGFNIRNDENPDGDTMADLADLALLAGDKVDELVEAYDVSNALGGSEWLDEHATDAEMYAVLKSILAITFPFVRDLTGAMSLVGSLMATNPAGVPSSPASSSSGASQTGTSDPTKSSPDSTTSS